MTLSVFLSAPKNQLALTLILIFITSLFNSFSLNNVFFLFIAVASCVVFDLLFLTIRKKPLFFPSAALVTGLLIGLVGNPNLLWYQTIFMSLFAIASKDFIRPTGRHIFNPAAFGLILGSLFFGPTISWWGTSWQQFPSVYFLILLSPVLVSMIRMRRFRITIAFLFIYVLLNQILNSKFLILNSLFDPTVLFFGTVMLPEPMTSPNNHTRQIVFGALVALISIIISLPILNSEFLILNSRLDPFLLSLLIGNLIFFKLR